MSEIQRPTERDVQDAIVRMLGAEGEGCLSLSEIVRRLKAQYPQALFSPYRVQPVLRRLQAFGALTSHRSGSALIWRINNPFLGAPDTNEAARR